jgi:hypothetical protein
VDAPARESSVFDGIDTSITGLFATLKHPAPAAAPALLGAIQREVEAAMRAFTMDNPSAAVPALARGLSATRDAIRQFSSDADAVYLLQLKAQQCADAINTALGIDFTAIAQPAGTVDASGPAAPFAPVLTMDPVVPGESFDVKMRFTNRGSARVEVAALDVAGAAGSPLAQTTLERDHTAARAARVTHHSRGRTSRGRPSQRTATPSWIQPRSIGLPRSRRSWRRRGITSTASPSPSACR